jgi:hypothetical protein
MQNFSISVLQKQQLLLKGSTGALRGGNEPTFSPLCVCTGRTARANKRQHSSASLATHFKAKWVEKFPNYHKKTVRPSVSRFLLFLRDESRLIARTGVGSRPARKPPFLLTNFHRVSKKNAVAHVSLYVSFVGGKIGLPLRWPENTNNPRKICSIQSWKVKEFDQEIFAVNLVHFIIIPL